VAIAIIVFARVNKLNMLRLGDVVAPCAPIGLFFGRLANFINGELWGRPADVPWAMIFPRGGPMPRHPSQLYQAFFEGIVLFSLMLIVWKLTAGRRRPALLTGVFCMGYGAARITGEFFREPDSFLGFILGTSWLSMGMLLSLPMILFGLGLVIYANRRPALAA
ncbi:MAG: prolipoprotein diacylglyceryl transferase, partial [Alphaproteobacteria bacterium]|nr:prolipoprotein diacylglyceryl transferase [Alphaproteobacteria bacterium]